MMDGVSGRPCVNEEKARYARNPRLYPGLGIIASGRIQPISLTRKKLLPSLLFVEATLKKTDRQDNLRLFARV